MPLLIYHNSWNRTKLDFTTMLNPSTIKYPHFTIKHNKQEKNIVRYAVTSSYYKISKTMLQVKSSSSTREKARHED